MDGQAAGQAPLRVDSTAAAFGGARRTRPPSRDAGRAHRGRATWALVPALRLAPPRSARYALALYESPYCQKLTYSSTSTLKSHEMSHEMAHEVSHEYLMRYLMRHLLRHLMRHLMRGLMRYLLRHFMR